MQRPRHQRPRQLRLAISPRRAARGVTLVELLVVILIMLLVTAVSIPTLVPALKGRQLREAARQVDTFLNGARTRALRTGRAVGVKFQREAGLGNQAAIRLSYVDVPAPYAGDSTSSVMVVDGRGRIHAITSVPPLPSSTPPPLWPPAQDFGWQALGLRPGDLVQLNHEGPLYRLYAGEPFVDLLPAPPMMPDGVYTMGEPYWDTDGDGMWSGANGALMNGVFSMAPESPPPLPATSGNSLWTLFYADPTRPMTEFTLPPCPALPGAVQAAGDPPYPVHRYPFQIFRQPREGSSAAEILQLPESVVVDLLFSGTTGSSPSSTTFAPLNVNDNASLIVTFLPSGAVDQIYQRSSTTGVVVGQRALDPIHFLIGKREYVPYAVLPPPPPPPPLPPNPNPLAPANPQPNNLWDLDSLWITINPRTGAIFTTENNVVPNRAAAYDVQFRYARELALESQRMGGR